MTDFSVEYLTLIADRKLKDDILKLLLAHQCHIINVVYAKGSVQNGFFKDMLGLVPEEKKIMITCLTTSDLSNDLLEQINDEFEFDKPNTGIAFIVPVDKMSV